MTDGKPKRPPRGPASHKIAAAGAPAEMPAVQATMEAAAKPEPAMPPPAAAPEPVAAAPVAAAEPVPQPIGVAEAMTDSPDSPADVWDAVIRAQAVLARSAEEMTLA